MFSECVEYIQEQSNGNKGLGTQGVQLIGDGNNDYIAYVRGMWRVAMLFVRSEFESRCMGRREDTPYNKRGKQLT